MADLLPYDYSSGEQGDPADADDIQAALSNLGYLFLGAEFCPGFDNDGTYEFGELVAYDNIILMPEPCALVLLALGGLLATKRRR